MGELPTVVSAYTELGILGLLAVIFVLLVWKSFGHKHEDDNWKKGKIDKKDEILEDDKQKISNQLQNLTEIFIKQSEESRKSEQERQDALLKMQETLIDKIVNGVTSHSLSHDENKRLTIVNQDIDIILQDILIETDASRVDLVQYHNGGKGINKQAFLKMSMTNEKIQLGVKPFIQDFKDQFRSVLGYFVNEINDKGYCDITDVDTVAEKDVGMYEFMKNRGIEAKFGYGIKNGEGTTIAFICVEYINKVDVNVEKVHSSLKEHFREVERLLNT